MNGRSHWRQLGTALVSVALVAATSATSAVPAHTTGSDDRRGVSLGEVGLVPLDDRPFTFYEPHVVGQAAAFDVAAPAKQLLGKFLTPGDATAVADWWRTEGARLDRGVVAVPMLAYGGLVASRGCGVDEDAALERLEVLEDVKKANPDQRLFAFDVIMRLAPTPTGTYPGTYAGEVREWAILLDQVNNLGMEEKRDELEQLAAEIPQEIKDDYMCARERNHAVNRAMLHLVDDGVIDYLILGQDDAEEHGLHRPERIALEKLATELEITDRVSIYPGADVLGPLLVGKHIMEELDVDTTVHATWSRTPGPDWVAPYQDVPYGELVDEYVRTLGGETVSDPDDADVLLMANTAGAGDLAPFASAIQEQVARGRTVAVADDARPGTTDPELFALLTDRMRLSDLASYSGWNVGLSLTHALTRRAMLQATAQAGRRPLPTPALLAAARAHIELLAQEFGHTHCYRNGPRSDVRDVAVDAGDDPQNMTFALEQAQQVARTATLPCLNDLADNEFDGARLLAGSVGGRTFVPTVASMDNWTVELAWNRYQEVEAVPETVLSMDADEHEYAVSASLTPYEQQVHPRFPADIDSTLIVRNVHSRTVTATVRVQPPDGVAAPDDVTVTLPARSTQEIPISFTVPAMGSETTLPWDVEVAHAAPQLAGERVTRADGVINVRNPNLAAAATGATASASGYTSPYEPVRAIDGNRESLGSRWLTDAGDHHWLRVDLAEPAVVDTVRLWQYPNYQLHDYQLSGLVDGSWVELVNVTGNQDVTAEHEFDATRVAALRLDVTGTRDGRARLFEFEAECAVSPECAAGGG